MSKVKPAEQERKRRRPALTSEGRAMQIAALAYDLVEQRMLDGTASSQETTYFLKYGSPKAVLERERLELENELVRAKTEQLQSQKRVEELYANAIKAMRQYVGYGSSQDYGEDDEYDDY